MSEKISFTKFILGIELATLFIWTASINIIIFVPYVEGYSWEMFYAFVPFWLIILGGIAMHYFLNRAINI